MISDSKWPIYKNRPDLEENKEKQAISELINLICHHELDKKGCCTTTLENAIKKQIFS